jgi:choline dehydrogenase-like flavoprotein
MQFYFAPLSTVTVREGTSYVGGIDPLPGLTATGVILRPTSEGEVGIVSADPAVPVQLRPHWLATAEDRACGLAAMKFLRRFVRQPALAGIVGEELYPGAAVEGDEALSALFFRDARTGNHAVGTCSMGRVVDARLRVIGVAGLRVADCSIIPEPVSGNTNAPAMAVGWRAAELIREEV